MKKIIGLLALVMSAACCGVSDTQRIVVASEMAECMGVAPQMCLLVKEPGADTWQFRYSGIEGFEHEAGYECELEIRKVHVENPPADASSIRYQLVRVISKTRKTSENMPPSVMSKIRE